SHLKALLSAADPSAVLPRSLLVIGGEASEWTWLDELQALGAGCRIMNHYGPTETTVGILTCPVGEVVRRSRTVPLGRPLAHTYLHVLNAAGLPVPVGVPGELYVGGRNVTRGYLNRDDLTEKSFVPDGFSNTPGARLYRTG